MSETTTLVREYHRILHAYTEVVSALLDQASPIETMELTFDDVVGGFGAEKALILVPEANRFEILCATKNIRASQKEAIKSGQSIRGVSTTVIQKVLSTKVHQIIEHPMFLREGQRTASLADYDYSILCAPVLAMPEPVLEHIEMQLTPEPSVRAIYYFQNTGFGNAYRASDVQFLTAFVRLLERLYDFQARLERDLIPPTFTLDEIRKRVYKRAIEERIRLCKDKTAAEKSLGVSHSTFFRLLRELQIGRAESDIPETAEANEAQDDKLLEDLSDKG